MAYAYVGYLLLLKVIASREQKLSHNGNALPSVSIIIAARNEALRLPAKIENLRQLRYPKSLLQVVIVSDGSTDETQCVLGENTDLVTAICLADSSGKATALNYGVEAATGAILVFLDVRQMVESDAVSELVACFADPAIGAVSGELLLLSSEGRPSGEGLGIYWKIEKAIRKLESQTGSVVGVTGAIYALRRELFQPLPKGVILDDVWVPMYVARQGKRVLFEPRAVAYDHIFAESGKEFSRKVRTLYGNFQLLKMAPWILTSDNPLLFRFVSHKLLRLFVPYFLLGMLLCSALASGMFYRAIFFLQIALYALAFLGLSQSLRKQRLINIPYTFVMLNVAAVVALVNILKNKENIW